MNGWSHKIVSCKRKGAKFRDEYKKYENLETKEKYLERNLAEMTKDFVDMIGGQSTRHQGR